MMFASSYCLDSRNAKRDKQFSLLDCLASPLGFKAGDANLYRYVGNSPTTYTDPDGMQKQSTLDETIKQRPNAVGVPGTVAGPGAIRHFFGGPNKQKILKNIPKIPSPNESTSWPPNGGVIISAKQKHHVVVPVGKMRQGDLVGTAGAQPCIGVIIRERQGPRSKIYAFHFDATENPIPTILQYRDSFKNANPQIIVFAGDNSAASNVTLQYVIDAFTKRNFQVSRTPSYIDTTGLFIDQNGKLCRAKFHAAPPDMNNK